MSVLYSEQTTTQDSQYYRPSKDVQQSRHRVDGGQTTAEVYDDTLQGAGVLQSRSPSDTEAEDEFQRYLKALPAAVKHPRKGLRSRQEERLALGDSPFLTPSQLENDDGEPEKDYFARPYNYTTQGSSKEETCVARVKFKRRRRAELLRRASELLSLVLLCAAVLADEAVQNMAKVMQSELQWSLGIICALLLLYPVRLLFPTYFDGRWHLHRLRIPSAFDPAPLLYPPVLPLLVSLSISPRWSSALLPNVILGLSTLPSQLIPFSGGNTSFDHLHWILTLLPLTRNLENSNRTRDVIVSAGLSSEELCLLFPLHQVLLPTLYFLTTSSLLPAELHLLSVSLLNLLLLSESPQSLILRAIIWLGGLGIFVTCGKVLRLNVALERIPYWKLQRAGRLITAGRTFVTTLSNGIGELENHHSTYSSELRQKRRYSSAYEPYPKSDFLSTSHPRQGTTGGSNLEKSSFTTNGDTSTLNGTKISDMSLRKVYTFPSSPDQDAAKSKGSSDVTSPSRSNRASYMSLTAAQITTKKLSYTAYAYVAMATLIALPIRITVGYALNGWEPFGWALSYLFGGIPALRTYVHDSSLESWIPLIRRSHVSESISIGAPDWFDHARIAWGVGNVRLALFVYWSVVLATGLFTVLRLLPEYAEVDTRRKVFHGMMVAMLLPTAFIDPCFLALGLNLVLVVFLLLDLLRASQLKPLSKPLARFLAPYVDGRDLRGPVIVSHMFLLIGCAIPLWLSLAGYDRRASNPFNIHTSQATNGRGDPWAGWELLNGSSQSRDLSMVAGVICVGMGDAAASLIGRRYGKRKWPWAGGKSLEGSTAFAVAVTAGLMFGKVWLRLGGWQLGTEEHEWHTSLGKAWVAACGASFTEAVLTGANDNVVVPIVLWLLVRGLQV